MVITIMMIANGKESQSQVVEHDSDNDAYIIMIKMIAKGRESEGQHLYWQQPNLPTWPAR